MHGHLLLLAFPFGRLDLRRLLRCRLRDAEGDSHKVSGNKAGEQMGRRGMRGVCVGGKRAGRGETFSESLWGARFIRFTANFRDWSERGTPLSLRGSQWRARELGWVRGERRQTLVHVFDEKRP